MARCNRRDLLYGAAIVCATVGLLLSIPRAAVYIVIYGLGIPGSLIIFCTPFRTRYRRSPQWVRTALWMASLALLGWSLLGFTLLFASARFSTNMNHLLQYIEPLFAGITLGILVLLQITGEMSSGLSNPKSAESADPKDAQNPVRN